MNSSASSSFNEKSGMCLEERESMPPSLRLSLGQLYFVSMVTFSGEGFLLNETDIVSLESTQDGQDWHSVHAVVYLDVSNKPRVHCLVCVFVNSPIALILRFMSNSMM